MAIVKGAGDSTRADNPKVRSKGDQHGMPRVPGHVSHVGGTAPITLGGSSHSTGKSADIYSHTGHMKPREAGAAAGEHKIAHHHPSTLGTQMVDGRRGFSALNNEAQTDEVNNAR